MTLIEIALIAQLAVCNSPKLSQETIEVHEYSAAINWQQVEEANNNYDANKVRKPTAAGDWMAFVFSKAKVKQEKLHIQIFQPLNDKGEPLAEAWLKLRHPNSLDEVFTCETKVSSNFSNAIMTAIQGAAGQSKFSQLKLQDNNINAGPDWLATAIDKETVGNEEIISIPVGTSPPNTPKRYAGTLYIKLPLM